MPGGGSNLDVIDAARRQGLPFVLSHTETAGAIMAAAQAEITSAPGVCLSTLGPGVASIVNGVAHTPSQWIVHAITREPWPAGDWLFAGSVFVKRQGEERYDADWSGTLIGLASFGTEVLAWKSVISPEAAVDEPVWIANPQTVPPVNTPIVVRLTAR